IMTVKKYSDVFKQLIGFISIKSDDSELEFNSDRTQFSQNSLTDDILEFIEKLNLKIQSIGSSLRKEMKYIDAFEKKSIDEEILDAFLTDNNFLNYIKPNFKLKQFLMPKLNNEKKRVEIWLFDNYISLEILQKEKEVKLMGSIEAWLDFGTLDEQVEGFFELIHSATQFEVDGTTVEEFYQQEGNWEIIKESPNSVEKTILNLKTVQPPKIQCVQNTVEMGRDYSLDELFKVWNSFNEEDKGIKFELDTEGNNTIHFNSSEGKVNFGRSGEQKIIIKITDKKTNLVHQSDFVFRVIQKAYEIPSASKENDKFIKSPINVKPNYNPDIIHFIDELNSVFQDENYNTIPVVSYRALVEIVVRDILSNLGVAKDESLLQNYSKVIEKSASIIKNSSLDADDKRTLGTLLTSLQSQDEKEAFLAFLNLSTHGGPRIITKTEALAKAKEIRFLIGILYITHCK
ncbi:TPA: ATP-binding protein, partial [Streptococcus suis]